MTGIDGSRNLTTMDDIDMPDASESDRKAASNSSVSKSVVLGLFDDILSSNLWGMTA